MGGNISRRLLQHGHDVVVFDRNQNAVAELGKVKAKPAKTLDDVVKQLTAPRTVWIMLPSGKPTESTIAELAGLLGKDDTIIDGGNTFYKDDIRRAKELSAKGIHYIDCGTSGGVWGVERGYCMMIGGEKDVVESPRPNLLRACAGPRHDRTHAAPREIRSARRTGLYPRRPRWRGPFRQDGAQWHRIRIDAGLRRRLRHPQG